MAHRPHAPRTSARRSPRLTNGYARYLEKVDPEDARKILRENALSLLGPGR